MNDRPAFPEALVGQLRAIVGERGLLTQAADLEPFSVHLARAGPRPGGPSW